MKKFNAADHIYAIDEGDNGVHIGGISVVDKHIEEQQRRIEELEQKNAALKNDAPKQYREFNAMVAHLERIGVLFDELRSKYVANFRTEYEFVGYTGEHENWRAIDTLLHEQSPQTSLAGVRVKQAKGSYYQGWIDCIEGEGQQDEHSQWRESPFAEGKRLSEQHAQQIQNGEDNE